MEHACGNQLELIQADRARKPQFAQAIGHSIARYEYVQPTWHGMASD